MEVADSLSRYITITTPWSEYYPVEPHFWHSTIHCTAYVAGPNNDMINILEDPYLSTILKEAEEDKCYQSIN